MANSYYSYIHYLFLCYFVTLNFFVEDTSAENSFCGLAAPDAEKMCISIRLPWQLEPIYFCTGKDQVKYRSNCRYEGQCGNQKANNDDLLIATPWECCPVTSTPDHCTKTTLYAPCSPQPFNRTCVITNSTSQLMYHHTGNECCPKYFCEEETQPENCKYKMLHPECMQPQNKTNCITFVDKHGCCNKYQCDEDEVKPGTCPQYTDSHPYYAPASYSGYGFRLRQRSLYDHVSCIGDFTCPEEQKCCPEMFSKLDGKVPVYGFCTQPVESTTVSSAV